MALIHGSKVKLFALSANKELGQEIADYIGLPLSECTTVRFADGEVMVNIGETVRGHDVFVVQPTSNPVNEHYMELLILIDALKRASAHTINIIMPYYGYSRQDRKAKAREPISAKLMADLLQAAGADRVLAMDLHAAQIQGFFNIPIDNFEALPLFVQYFCAACSQTKIYLSKYAENICTLPKGFSEDTNIEVDEVTEEINNFSKVFNQ